ncbi:MAG: hypothetical protein ABI472_14685 [Ginsengibacter sp.]
MIKHIVTVFVFQSITLSSFCQKSEFNLNVYSGLFSYTGNGAAGTSIINYGIYTPTPYTTNVYGNKPGFSISFGGEAVSVTKSKVLYGAGLSYDLLESKIKIDKVQYSPEVVVAGQSYLYDANGSTRLRNTYFNINPFIGRRFLKNGMTIDLSSGIDIGICLKNVEQGNATITATNDVISTNVTHPHPSIDIRPRIQLKAGYKRAGIIIGYSPGLTNYQSTKGSKAYTSFMRLGFSYRIK